MVTLQGGISKSRNIQKSLGARIARMLAGPYNKYDEHPNTERLLNLYSLLGPEYVNSSMVDIGHPIDFLGWGYGNTGIYGALSNYAKRTGAFSPYTRVLAEQANKEGKKVILNPEIEDVNTITQDDINNIGQVDYTDGKFKYMPDPKQESYARVLNQLTPYADINNGYVGVRGTYHNTLPQFMQRFTHPLQVDLGYQRQF